MLRLLWGAKNDIVRLLLERWLLQEGTRADRQEMVRVAASNGLLGAANADRVDVARLVLEKLGPSDSDILCALVLSADAGYEEMAGFSICLGKRPHTI